MDLGMLPASCYLAAQISLVMLCSVFPFKWRMLCCIFDMLSGLVCGNFDFSHWTSWQAGMLKSWQAGSGQVEKLTSWQADTGHKPFLTRSHSVLPPLVAVLLLLLHLLPAGCLCDWMFEQINARVFVWMFQSYSLTIQCQDVWICKRELYLTPSSTQSSTRLPNSPAWFHKIWTTVTHSLGSFIRFEQVSRLFLGIIHHLPLSALEEFHKEALPPVQKDSLRKWRYVCV